MPKVSIIIPNFNHAPYLEMRIRSVLEQTFSDTEVVLLDDCSTDESLAILTRYRNHPKVARCIFNEVNSGSAFRQWERGIASTTGEYIWVAESDDLASPNFLAHLCGALDAHPSVGLAYCQSAKIDAAGSTIGSWSDLTEAFPEDPWRNNFIAKGRDMVRGFLLFRNVVPNASAALFRRRCLSSDVMREAANYANNGDWFVWSNILLLSDMAFSNLHYNFCRFHAGKGSIKNIYNCNNILELYRLRGFLYEALGLPDNLQQLLNADMFQEWMSQRRFLRLAKDAPEMLKVLAAAEIVDPSVRTRLASEPE
jgi:glycosyltransferase involved in cell wall biosynthesis